MISRSQAQFGLCRARLAGDSAYGSAEMLQWLVHERGIEPHIPVFDKSKRADHTFSRSDFAFNAGTDIYLCPGGKQLTTTGTVVNDGTTLLCREQARLPSLWAEAALLSERTSAQGAALHL